jgi:hypothetical protein
VGASEWWEVLRCRYAFLTVQKHDSGCGESESGRRSANQAEPRLQLQRDWALWRLRLLEESSSQRGSVLISFVSLVFSSSFFSHSLGRLSLSQRLEA